jgi:2-polyprenyl-3-methyl-5-hydroxy-6-metoxy-1,4-benzoquinol methylase
MDEPEIPAAELAGDLRNLAWINRLLGGIAVICTHLPGGGEASELGGPRSARTTRRKRRAWPPGKPAEAGFGFPAPFTGLSLDQTGPLGPGNQVVGWTVLDVATGGGDIPRWLARQRAGPDLLLAADRHPQMLALAREWSAGLPIRFLRCDARRLPFRDRSVEVVLCSLMLHHLTETDAVTALRELARVTRRRLIVNDLRRSRLARSLIWLITRFSRNRLTRFDSPVSVERAFTPEELAALAREAGLGDDGRFQIHRHRFYRMALVYEPQWEQPHDTPPTRS